MPSVPLYRRGEVVGHALVDEEDWERFRYSRWRPTTVLGYATRTVGGRSEYLHRLILGLEPGDGMECDHINRNPLDNRRCNLRAVTHSENMRNIGTPFGRSRKGSFDGVAARNETDARVLELANDGLGVRRVATELGMTVYAVRRVFAAYE